MIFAYSESGISWLYGIVTTSRTASWHRDHIPNSLQSRSTPVQPNIPSDPTDPSVLFRYSNHVHAIPWNPQFRRFCIQNNHRIWCNWNTIEPRHEKTCLRGILSSGYPIREDSNPPAQLQRPARVLKFWIYQVYVLYCLKSEQQRCRSDCADAQADLHLCCSYMAKAGYLMTCLPSDPTDPSVLFRYSNHVHAIPWKPAISRVLYPK